MENQKAANDQSIDRKYFDEESNRLSYELSYDLVEKDTADIVGDAGMRSRIESQDSVKEILEGINNKRSVTTV